MVTYRHKLRNLAEFKHPSVDSIEGNTLRRQAAYGIIQPEQKILLLYTERYDDFSFPGGGIDKHEDLTSALKRELREEAGVTLASAPRHFGYTTELQPFWKPQWPKRFQTSHWFDCEITAEQLPPQMEDYEVNNGSRPVWTTLEEAIQHNYSVLKAKPDSMGLSIQRDTFILEQVIKELVSA